MSTTAGGPRRSGTTREEQVRTTRRRILAAAQELFLERGYLGTTVEAVAGHARVSVQSIYNVVGGKADLLKAVWDTMLAGNDDPVPMINQPTGLAMQGAPDGHTCLMLYARMAREIYERIGALLGSVYGEGAGHDPAVREFLTTIDRERAIGTRGVAQLVAERHGLRDGLSTREAADILWVLTAPDASHRLIRNRRWSLVKYERWLGEAMADSLLPR
ncbi:MAG: helix-turn-helix domain-containing protein [Nocardioides sp.]|uniref:TetR/AcrR family transcriptional regulator n=1 Tax=Nocardioides sp. TaxID=35761 RepID=UPI0039E23D36